jgi:cytoskeletal protein RodZ
MRSLKLPTYNRGEQSIPEDMTDANTSNEPIERPGNESLANQPSVRLREIGIKLYNLRQSRHLSIEEVSAKTQIQPRLIEAIEAAQIDLMPESVYVKGMVKRYGDYMGLDGAALVENFPTWQRSSTAPTPSKSSRRQTTIVINPQIKPLHLYLGYTVLVLGAIAGISHLVNNTVKTKPTQPIAVTEIAPAPRPVAPVPPPSVTQLPPKLTIAIEIKSPTQVKVIVDGKPKFSGNLKVGDKHTWGAQQKIEIETNNAGGILLSQDKQTAQLLGKLNQKQKANFQVKKSP